MKNINYKKQFARNNLWVLVGHSLVYLKGIILLPLLIKTVGVDIYGANALISSYIGILFGLSTFGVTFKYTRLMPSILSTEYSKKRELFYFQFFWQLIFLVIISFVLFFANSFVKETFFSKSIDYSIIWPITVLWGTFLYSQTTNYYRYTHRLKITSIIGGLSPYLYISIILLGVLLSLNVDLNFLLKSQSISYFILSIPLLIAIFREIGYKRPLLSLKKLYEHVKVGIPLIFVFVIDFILSGSDRFVIAYYMTTTAVGFYNPGYTLGSLVIMFPKMIGVSLPQILAHASDHGDESSVKALIENSIKIFLILCIPFIAGGALLSHDLLLFLANKQVANTGYLVTPIVSFGILFYGLNYILANTVYYLRMKNQLVFYSNIIAAVLNIILNIIFISIFRSIIVAAITTLISYVIAFVFLNFFTKRLIKINYNYFDILKIIIASIFMSGFILLMLHFTNSGLYLFLLVIPIAIVIYFGLIFYFQVVNIDELKGLVPLIKSKK